MDRIRLFQRSLITILVGINSFVFCFSNDLGAMPSLVYSVSAMLCTLLIIAGFILLKKRYSPRRFRTNKQIN
jgi:hypothetical protein